MNILSHFSKVLEKTFYKFLSSYSINTINSFDNPYNINCYKQIIEDFDSFTSSFSKDVFEQFLRFLDDEFLNSDKRKNNYKSKGFVTKRLTTVFGVIDFKRRRYVDSNGKSFMFLDTFLGIVKYKRLDPFVIAKLIEESASNSYAKAGRIVSKQIGSKVKYDDDINKYSLSRATVRNNVIDGIKIINEPIPNILKVVDILNVMLDEKHVPSQFNNKQDHMIKAAVIFEGTEKEYNNRTRLTGKTVLATVDKSIVKQLVDYIYYNYDTDKIKVINVMGDGANWIKNIATKGELQFNKNIKIIYGLDHFHVAQALKLLTTNKHIEFYNILYDYIKYNNKEDFITVYETFLSLNLLREDTIIKKGNYILNNWKYIQNSINKIQYKCSMESDISHVFADLFTARPKGYSKQGIKVLLKLRLLKTNGHDLKKLYLDSLQKKIQKDKEDIVINNNTIKEDKYFNSVYVPMPAINQSNGTSTRLKQIINGGFNL